VNQEDKHSLYGSGQVRRRPKSLCRPIRKSPSLSGRGDGGTGFVQTIEPKQMGYPRKPRQWDDKRSLSAPQLDKLRLSLQRDVVA
jgi:hypothetical protein